MVRSSSVGDLILLTSLAPPGSASDGIDGIEREPKSIGNICLSLSLVRTSNPLSEVI